MASVRIAIALLLFTRLAAADGETLCRLTGQVADVARGGSVEGARVQVSDRGGLRSEVSTDRAGHYEVYVRPGDYDVVFEYGTSRTVSHVSVTSSCVSTLDGHVDRTGGEVIVIQDQKPPKVQATPQNFSPRRAPPYSEEALDKDAWTRAWMLLDVSATGEVSQFKFLKRPGYDLENIAASEVFRLTFNPARDEHDRPMRTFLVWGIEWTSNGWLMAMNLPRTMMPPIVGFPPRSSSATVPCKGSGPMHLMSVHPTYRDCSTPDLSQVAKQPWIVRP
jgi:hypothetical protein